MRLQILSTRSVRNAIFSNESGQVMYKTTHPRRLSMGTTTLHKIKPNDDPTDMRDQFDMIGKIEWHMVGSSAFCLHGETMPSNEFLPSHGLFKRKRTFTGPDGRAYRWDMLIIRRTVVLSQDNDMRAEVARYHRGSLGIIGRKQQPYLEVHSDMEHLLDLIVLTFVYVEKIRMDKDRENTGP